MGLIFSLPAFAFDRNTYLRHKLFRLTCNAVINKRYFAGKAANLKMMLLYKPFQLSILLRRLNMVPAETNADAKHLWQGEPIKQIVRYAIASFTASAGVDIAKTMGRTSKSRSAVSATDTAIKSVTVFPMRLFLLSLMTQTS